MPRIITSMSARIDPGREDECPDGNSGQQPTALAARSPCADRVVPGASRRPRVTSTPNGGPARLSPPLRRPDLRNGAIEVVMLGGLGIGQLFFVLGTWRLLRLPRAFHAELLQQWYEDGVSDD